MPRLPASLLVAGATLAPLLAPAAAGAVSPLLFERELRVTALTASSVSTYEMPKRYGASNCAGKPWSEAHGRETLKFGLRRPVRVGVVLAAGGTATFIRTDGDDATIESGIPAGGSKQSDMRWISGREAGECAGEIPATTDIGNDCGTKMMGFAVSLQVLAGELRLQPLPEEGAPFDQGTFGDCYVPKAGSGTDGGWEKTVARVKTRDLMKSRRAITVKASKTFREPLGEITPGEMVTTTTWSVTLTPVVKKAAGRKPAKRRPQRRR